MGEVVDSDTYEKVEDWAKLRAMGDAYVKK